MTHTSTEFIFRLLSPKMCTYVIQLIYYDNKLPKYSTLAKDDSKVHWTSSNLLSLSSYFQTTLEIYIQMGTITIEKHFEIIHIKKVIIMYVLFQVLKIKSNIPHPQWNLETSSITFPYIPDDKKTEWYHINSLPTRMEITQ